MSDEALKIFIFIAVINAVAYYGFDSPHGSPSCGKIENGHYYVGLRPKGSLTPIYHEVAKGEYERCSLHEKSVSLTLPLALIAALYFGIKYKSYERR